ncbi:hypothetical protein [Actinomadura sp. 9N407]|uniref:hypothetical protein n=1 Tax=Actinomadura sp. 9N407 TaxID=3375154 RepID=UPI00378BC7C5
MPVRRDGGALRGGAPRVVWFSSESDPRVFSARSVAADLVREETPAHLVWNPCSGEIVQLIPITRAGGVLGEPVRHEGRACVQVMVVGHARDPFTGTLLAGLEVIMAWLDAWGIGRRWPAGPPLPPPQSYNSGRTRRDWARGGHFGASQVPGPYRLDPGGIDIRRITGPATPVTAIPRQRPIPAQGTVPAQNPAARNPAPGPDPVPAQGPAPVEEKPRPIAAQDPSGPDSPRDTPHSVPPDPLPLPAEEPAAAVVVGANPNGGTRIPVPVPLPRTAEPVGAATADSLSNGTKRPSPLATSAPPTPPQPAQPFPEPARMRS